MSESPLKNYQKFQEVLKSYRVSERALAALSDLRLVLLIAPTSSGRNTIIRYLVQTGDYHYLTSDTTRAPRTNDGVLEQNGQEYWFRTEEEVLSDLLKGEYLEAELIHGQQVSGISIRELEKANSERKIAVTDIDLQGIHNVVRVKPDTHPIMLIPPSFDEWQRRIAQRGRMGNAEYVRRLETAYRIFEDGLRENYYKFVVAENVEQSAAIINGLVAGKANPHQDRGRELIQSLQESLREKLN